MGLRRGCGMQLSKLSGLLHCGHMGLVSNHCWMQDSQTTTLLQHGGMVGFDSSSVTCLHIKQVNRSLSDFWSLKTSLIFFTPPWVSSRRLTVFCIFTFDGPESESDSSMYLNLRFRTSGRTGPSESLSLNRIVGARLGPGSPKLLPTLILYKLE